MLSRTADHLFWTEAGQGLAPVRKSVPAEAESACKPIHAARYMERAERAAKPCFDAVTTTPRAAARCGVFGQWESKHAV